MEECEALCTRNAILNQGQLVALGTPQHLKSRFGDAYNIQLKPHIEQGSLSGSVPAPLAEFMQANFPTAKLLPSHGDVLSYALPQSDTALGRVFNALLSNAQRLQLEDYSVSQPTMEQIFLRLTKLHDEMTAQAAGQNPAANAARGH